MHSNAKLSINGWSRNEIRVFVKNGSDISFRVHEKDPGNRKAGLGLDRESPPETVRAARFECLSGDKIEIDVPVNAGLTISAARAETVVDSVKKVYIKSLGGDVSLRNISGGITAITYQGNLAVENSAGQISLETSTGNIVAYGVTPGPDRRDICCHDEQRNDLAAAGRSSSDRGKIGQRHIDVQRKVPARRPLHVSHVKGFDKACDTGRFVMQDHCFVRIRQL